MDRGEGLDTEATLAVESGHNIVNLLISFLQGFSDWRQ